MNLFYIMDAKLLIETPCAGSILLLNFGTLPLRSLLPVRTPILAPIIFAGREKSDDDSAR